MDCTSWQGCALKLIMVSGHGVYLAHSIEYHLTQGLAFTSKYSSLPH